MEETTALTLHLKMGSSNQLSSAERLKSHNRNDELIFREWSEGRKAELALLR
jgi:hypothetical protein